TQGLAAAPRYFGYDAQLNKEKRDTLETTLERTLKPLSLEQLLAHQRAGGLVLDTRHSDEFAAGHLAGSVSIGLWGKYANWAGTLLDPREPLALVTAPGAERESAMRLGRIGLDRVAGYLAGGVNALTGRPDLTARFERIDPPEVFARLRSGGIVMLDVREPVER